MKKRMLQMVVAVVVVVAALGFVKFQQIRAAMAMGRSYAPPPEAVTTLVARPQRWESTLEATGSVAPVQGVTLSADEPGVVRSIEFQSGAHVRAGQALVRLDTRQEQAQLASAEAQHELDRTRLERGKKLFDQQLLSHSDYDDLTAQFAQSEAAVHVIQASIERKTIRAPFEGAVGIRQVNLGQYVRSGDPIVPLQSEDPIYVNFAVPQQQVASLRAGATVLAASDSGAQATVTGRITAINPVVDEATRNVQIQATFRNAEGRLRAGGYVTVKVMLGAGAPLIALPTSAISFAPYGNSVFIVEPQRGPDGKRYVGVRQQFVKLGAAQGDRVVVLDGVKAGEEVVTSGAFKLRPNAAVVVNNRVQPSNSLAPRPKDS
jgi:membrane fusion protein, multidrug efflux system